MKKGKLADYCFNYCDDDKTCSNCDGSTSFPKCKPEQVEVARPAATPEPMSKPGDYDVFPELVKDLEARVALGKKKYGFPLQTHNGRNALNDAFQECLDMAMYLKQALMEREKTYLHAWQEKIAGWANDRGLYKNTTPFAQFTKLLKESLEWHFEVQRGDREAEKMELGDMFVALTNIANSRGLDLQECGFLAYEKIKNRTGHIENGSFVKDSK